jgi:diaminopimelate epimerase
MKIHFYKYQGTGNDFVMIDNRSKTIELDDTQVALLCHRKFGVGADGLILLENDAETLFKMVYYNADGRQSTMCGNGGRCISHFAGLLNIVSQKGSFSAIDGLHDFELTGNDIVKLKMNDVHQIKRDGSDFVLDTGSPHYVTFDDDLLELDLVSSARAIRYNPTYAASGINVNFVEVKDNQFFMRTYERGVEDETASCGTGTVAVALTLVSNQLQNVSPIVINTYGGELKVHFNENAGGFSDIWLEGPAKMVFEGQITI